MSQQNRELLRGYAEMVSIGIDNLPNEYDEIKNNAKKNFSKNTGLFSMKGAIDLRANGNLAVKKLQLYGEYLKQMTIVPIMWFYFWSIVPKDIAKKISISDPTLINEKEKQRLNELNEKGSRLIIYGVGEHGTNIIYKIEHYYKRIEIVAISDKNHNKTNGEFCIISPDEIPGNKFDYVAITIVNEKIYKEAKKALIKLGISAKKIFHI